MSGTGFDNVRCNNYLTELVIKLLHMLSDLSCQPEVADSFLEKAPVKKFTKLLCRPITRLVASRALGEPGR